MKRNSVFTKLLAMLLCVMMVIGCLPLSAFADQWEGDIDVVEDPEGSETNPLLLTQLENTVTVGAGSTIYYYGYFSGMIMNVSGATGYEILVGEESTQDTVSADDETVGTVTMDIEGNNPREPFHFAVANNTEADVQYSIVFTYPVGSQDNPLVASLGDNAASVAAGDTDGYVMTYTADHTGNLVVTISAEAGWMYVVNNMTAYSYGDTQWSDSDPVVNPTTIAVTAGDEIEIIVNTYDSADQWNNPAGNINVNLAYELGSCPEAAIFLGDMENSVTNAGTVYYMGYFSGTVMTVSGEGDFTVTYNGEAIAAADGVVSIPVSTSNPRMPVEFSVTGDGDYTINFAYPAGSQANPAVAVLGDNVATIAAGNTQGYYYTYTAEKAGDLIVTISAETGWTYTINNMTAYSYGDTQWSDSDPVANPATITVAEGDELQIIVNTYDPADMWNTPAGTITMNLAYNLPKEPTVPIKFSGASLTLESSLRANFIVAKEVHEYYEDVYAEVCRVDSNTGLDTEVITIKDFTVDGTTHLYSVSGIAPRMMNDTLKVTIYGTYDGVQYSKTIQYKLTTYCYSTLRNTSDSHLKTLIVDLLNYATEHQEYMEYNLENPINGQLTDAEKALASTHELAPENVFNGKYKVIDNATVALKGVSLTLSDAVLVYVEFECADLTGVTATIVVDGKEYSVDSFKTVNASTNRYAVEFNQLRAIQMNEPVEVYFCRDGEVTSNTMQYSVASYVAQNQNNTSVEGLADLIKAMLRYGDSAYNYVNS